MYDPIQWSYPIDCGAIGCLEKALLDHIRQLVQEETDREIELKLWRALAIAEITNYTAAQLRRHGFDTSWGDALVGSVMQEWEHFSLGQQRYFVWAAVRQGAARFLQSFGDMDVVFESMLTELRRRSRWFAPSAGVPGKQVRTAPNFVPKSGWRNPILLDLFLTEISSVGDGYWNSVPPVPSK